MVLGLNLPSNSEANLTGPTNPTNSTNPINPINSINIFFMKITRFEEINAWQEARDLVKIVYKVINKNKEFGKDFRLVNQIQGSAVSTMANVAEGFARKSNKEFIQYLFISKSSAAEVQSHLYVALDQKFITQEDFRTIYDQAEKVSKMDSNFIKYLKTTLNKPK
jgi:four helix bundle protein